MDGSLFPGDSQGGSEGAGQGWSSGASTRGPALAQPHASSHVWQVMGFKSATCAVRTVVGVCTELL